jgi:hypothetical protein
MTMNTHWATPFEQGNGNQTATWQECIHFHLRLAQAFGQWLRFEEAGRSDGGTPIHVGVFSADGVFDPQAVKAAGRPVFFNNNGIHPGEPEGIDACMALLRDLCLDPAKRAALGRTVLVYIPIYNVDGALNRQDTSRVNQNGPEAFGFRGNARHLDLNRDFIKADSLNTRTFAQVFTRWDPDVMVDTHTSNGADYQHVVTLIATQPDKLGGRAGTHLREMMLPALYADMAARGFPLCPYVNPLKEIPDDGIADFLDSPRFSTGYAALHHTLGFMPETHMLKPFDARYHGTRALVESALAYTVVHGGAIREARAADRAAIAGGAAVALDWKLDLQRSRTFRFSGFRAVYEPSRLGSYQRLRYDRMAPWDKDIPYFDRYEATTTAVPPRAYLLPQAWHDVALRLQAHGVPLRRATSAGRVPAEAYRIQHYEKRPVPYEGRHLHDVLEVQVEPIVAEVAAGDWLVPLGGPCDRFIVEVLEPLGMDSFFLWAFFDSVLNRKEGFSDYVFEDEAEHLLATEPGLRQHFEDWKATHPELLGDPQAVLGCIFSRSQRHAEPEWRRYPVLRLLELPPALWAADTPPVTVA